MSSATIQPLRAPHTEGYFEGKQQIHRNEKLASARSTSKSKTWQVDTVTLSSEQQDDNNHSSTLKPSQPVTFEEKQALMSTFSSHS